MVLFALLALGAPRARCAQDSEPAYNGKPLSHWVEILGGPTYSSKSWPDISEIPGGYEARDALKHIGTNAIPFLLKWLGQDGVLGPQATVQAFRILGPTARSAIPELAFMVTNQLNYLPQQVGIAAAKLEVAFIATNQIDPTQLPSGGVMTIGYYPLSALGCIGPDALPTLLAILSNNVAGIRVPTIYAISGLGSNATPAVPALIRCLNDPNEMVSLSAIHVLSRIPGESVFGALTNLLHSRPSLRSETLEALAAFGDKGVPFLVDALSDSNNGTRYIVSNTLIRIAPNALTNATVVAWLGFELCSPDAAMRDWAALMLRAAGQVAHSQKPQHLSEVPLGDMNPIRLQATNALRQLAPELLRNSP